MVSRGAPWSLMQAEGTPLCEIGLWGQVIAQWEDGLPLKGLPNGCNPAFHGSCGHAKLPPKPNLAQWGLEKLRSCVVGGAGASS